MPISRKWSMPISRAPMSPVSSGVKRIAATGHLCSQRGHSFVVSRPRQRGLRRRAISAATRINMNPRSDSDADILCFAINLVACHCQAAC